MPAYIPPTAPARFALIALGTPVVPNAANLDPATAVTMSSIQSDPDGIMSNATTIRSGFRAVRTTWLLAFECDTNGLQLEVAAAGFSLSSGIGTDRSVYALRFIPAAPAVLAVELVLSNFNTLAPSYVLSPGTVGRRATPSAAEVVGLGGDSSVLVAVWE